jgi:hypothetical protein
VNFLGGARRRRSSDGNYNDYDSYSESIRQRVFRELDKNAILTPFQLCRILQIDYKHWHQTVANYKTQWRYTHKNERGSKCSLHGWRGWCCLPNGVAAGIRSGAVEVGWVETRARNRWLLWKERLGRLQWFETGRVNLFVRKPANLGKAYQLVCNGFSFTGLVTDIKVLEQILGSVRFKGAHYVFSTEQRLPRLTIDLFAKSNGVIIKVGDRSHPHAVEVIACYPDWAERNERVLEQLNDTLRRLFEPAALNKVDQKKVDYVA